MWFVATRRWRALTWCAATAGVLAAITATVLGPGIFVDYLRVIVGASGGGRTWALWVVAAGLAGVVALGRHERAGFALAVALIPFGSPVAAGHTWALLLAALAPAVRTEEPRVAD